MMDKLLQEKITKIKLQIEKELKLIHKFPKVLSDEISNFFLHKNNLTSEVTNFKNYF